MMTGMLWMDADKKATLEEKVRKAAAFFRQKYGAAPAVCLVNKQAAGEETAVDGITVEGVKTVLPHHFLLGPVDNSRI